MIKDLKFSVGASELNMNSYIEESKFTKSVMNHFSEMEVPIYRIQGTLYIRLDTANVVTYNGYIIGGKFLEMDRSEFNSYISKL